MPQNGRFELKVVVNGKNPKSSGLFPTKATGFRVELRHALVRAVKEALHNGLKYCNAKEVWLRTRTRRDSLEVEIEDEGKRFRGEEESLLGNGIKNVRRRMAELGSHAEITSTPGKGTDVLLRVPLKKT